VNAAVLTVSDGVSAGVREDSSGDLLETLLKGDGFEVERRIVSDDADLIASAMRELADSGVAVVLTTGGTGFAPRDVTPEATRSVVEREAPGLAEAVRVSVVQIPNSLFRIHSGISENLSRGGAADSVDVRQPDLELLLAWQIHAGDTCHLSLSLLVLGVSLADDAHHSGALDHLAVLTNWFDAAAYFHKCSYRRANIPAGRGEGIPS